MNPATGDPCSVGGLLTGGGGQCTAQVIGSLVNSQIAEFTKQLFAGANDLWTGFFTSWIDSPLSSVVGGSTADWFASIIAPVQGALLALGIMVAGIRIMLLARGEVAGEAAKRFLRAILVTVAGAAFFQIMLLGSNALARWFIDVALNDKRPDLLGEGAMLGQNTALAFIFGMFLFLAVGAQWIIMIFRDIALTVIIPFWPIAASGAMFDKHEAMFEKTTTWLLAFLLYSPLAAAMYGLSIRLRGAQDGLPGVVVGLGIFLLALFALPALLKLVAPVASAIGSASPGNMAMNGLRTVATAAVAGGAIVATAGAAAPAVAGVGAAGVGAGAGGVAGGGAGGLTGAGANAAGASAGSGHVGGSGVNWNPCGGGNAPSGGGGESSSSAPATVASGTSTPSNSGRNAASSSSGRGLLSAARDATHALPQGTKTSVGEMFDE